MTQDNQSDKQEGSRAMPKDLLASSPELEMILKAKKGIQLNPKANPAQLLESEPEAQVFSDLNIEDTHSQQAPAPGAALNSPASPLRYSSPEEEVLRLSPRAPAPQRAPSVTPSAPVQTPQAQQVPAQTPISRVTNSDGYVNKGAISVEDALTGDARRYDKYNARLEELLTLTQEKLIEQKINIEESLKDPIKKAALISKIDSIVLTELMDGRVQADVKKFLIASVINEIVGLGPIEPIWQDKGITEVMVNGPDHIYVEKEGKLSRATGVHFRSQEHLSQLCQRIIQSTGGKFDVTTPTADGRLPDGSRVNVVHQNLANPGPTLTIRRFPELNRSLVDLVALGALNQDMAALLSWLVANKASSLIVGGTGTGKALDVDTPIPTPKGFVRMGDITVGDTVFDEQGRQTLVIGAYAAEANRPCYNVSFSDGSSIVADAEHLWLTYERAARALVADSYYHTILVPEHSCSHSKSVVELVASRGEGFEEAPTPGASLAYFLKANAKALPSVRTTEEIRASLMEDKHYNHSIPVVANAVSIKTQALGIAPKVMGSFLAMPIESRQEFLTLNKQLSATMLKNVSIDYRGIPTNYLFSSPIQRRELLAGIESLLGNQISSGYMRITSNSEKLIKDTGILLSSLGFQAHLESEVDSEYDSLYSLEYREPRSLSDSHRYIVAITEVASRPVRCIRVVNDSHLFLAGLSFTPTHNTTLLNALSSAIPRDERIVTIEDTFELRLHPDSHVVGLEARKKDSKNENAVDIKDLVINALRMRPDRIIVGEVRGAEALNMLEACNTGHEGSMSTIHANGPNEALARLATMIAQGGKFPSDKVDWLVGSALDIMVQIRRYKDGSRKVSGIYEVPDIYSVGKDEPLRTIPLWEWVQTEVDDGRGHLVGEYRKRQEMSPHLTEKLGLAFTPMLKWGDVEALARTV